MNRPRKWCSRTNELRDMTWIELLCHRVANSDFAWRMMGRAYNARRFRLFWKLVEKFFYWLGYIPF